MLIFKYTSTWGDTSASMSQSKNWQQVYLSVGMFQYEGYKVLHQGLSKDKRLVSVLQLPNQLVWQRTVICTYWNAKMDNAECPHDVHHGHFQMSTVVAWTLYCVTLVGALARTTLFWSNWCRQWLTSDCVAWHDDSWANCDSRWHCYLG